ncbi:MAG: hypothetical protein U0794_02475 [Isosphaeraceae bacterium]
MVFRPGFQRVDRRLEFTVETDPPEHEFGLWLNARVDSGYEVEEEVEGLQVLALGIRGEKRLRVTSRRRGREGLSPPVEFTVSPPLSIRSITPISNSETDGVAMSASEIVLDLPPMSKPGLHRGTVTARWSDGRTIPHHVVWDVRSRLRIVPASLILEPGDTARSKRVIVSTEGEPIRINSVGGPLVASVLGVGTPPAKRHVLERVVDSGRSSGQPDASDVVIQTDDPREPIHRLPILLLPGR